MVEEPHRVTSGAQQPAGEGGEPAQGAGKGSASRDAGTGGAACIGQDPELSAAARPDGEFPAEHDATILDPAALFISGLVIEAPAAGAVAQRARRVEWAGLGCRIFGWLTVLPVLLVAAWLLPGLPLLLAGRFLPVPMVLIAVPLAALFAVLAAWYMPAHWPGPGHRAGPPPSWAAWWGLAGTVVIAAGFAAWQLQLDSPQLILVRQPGVYTQLGYWIAQHASLPIPGAAASFGGSHAGLGFASYGFAAQGTMLVPWELPGLPLVLAAGAWIHGLGGLAVVSPVLGACAVLTVAGLTGRLAGLAWAPAGALAAALTLPEILTSRSAYAEPLVELLLFGGLCLLTDSLVARTDAGSGLALGPARWRLAPSGTASLAGLGGLVLGLTVLAQAGTLFVLLPVIPFAAVLAAPQRPRAASFSIGLVLGVGYGLAGGLVLAPPAMTSLSPSLRMIGLAVVWTAALTLAGVAIGYRERARAALARRPLRWLPEAVAALVAAVAVAFAVRPYVEVVRGAGGSGYVGWLQRLAGLPADPQRLYSEDSLYWVVWYLGLPAVVLGVAGLALLARRSARALLSWHDPAGDARVQALPLLIIGWGALTVLWQPGTVPDQPWAGRTLVPVMLPGLVVCAVWAAAWLTARARERGAGAPAVALSAVFFTAALAVPSAITSFALGTPRPAAGARLSVAGVTLGGAAGQPTGAGQAAAVSRLCGRIGQQSSVVIIDGTAARAFAPVLRGMCGIPAAVMVGASHGQLMAVAHGIARAGRRPVLLASAQAPLRAFEPRPQQVIGLVTRQDAHLLNRPPNGTWQARYQAWIAAPPAVAGA